MGKYFGTDGFRGEANVVLTVEHAFKVGRYLGWYFGQEHKARIVIGKDTRRSSYMFEYALAAGLTASGADAYLLHVTTTPSVSYVVRTEDFDCGLMISASHNPYYDNGIKAINSAGHKMEAEVEEKCGFFFELHYQQLKEFYIVFEAGSIRVRRQIHLQPVQLATEKMNEYCKKGGRYLKLHGPAALAQKVAGKVKNMYDKPTDNEEVGVTLTIPIFDWGAKKAKVKSSQLAMESDEISLEEQKKEIVIDVRQICRNLPTLIRQIEIKKKSIENAERTYEINLEKYRNGNLTGMDLQQFQNQLTTAKQDYTSAIISYKIELLNLKIQTLWDFETHKSYLPVDLLK